MPKMRKTEWAEEVDDEDESLNIDDGWYGDDPSEDGEPVVTDTPLQTLGSILRATSKQLDTSKPKA